MQPMFPASIALAGVAAMVLAGVTWWALGSGSPAAPPHRVSQRNQAFMPGQLEIRVGEVVRVVNDDGDLSHHAYVSSPRFRFDSGDQGPGANVDIPFTAAGTFNVLCGIHPKMRLVVTVR